MRAHEFVADEPRKQKFADGYLTFSDHLVQRLKERNIDRNDVLQVLAKLERTRSMDLIKMPFITFVVKSPSVQLGFSKQLDKNGNTAYVVSTARDILRSGEDEDVIYLEEDPEPRHEEHHFGSDEQDHAVAQVQLHHRGMIAGMRFLNDVRPPAEHGEGDAEYAGEEDIATEWHRVHPHDRSE